MKIVNFQHVRNLVGGGEEMARREVVEKLKAIFNSPEAMERLEEEQKRARETIDFIHKASQIPANWRKQRFTI